MSKTTDCLNEAFRADPNAIHALMVNRVPCNQALADHPHVVVDSPPVLDGQFFSVGAVGILNGVLTANGLPRVGVAFEKTEDEEGRCRITGFGDVMVPSRSEDDTKPLMSIEDAWEFHTHLELLRSEEASEVTFTFRDLEQPAESQECVEIKDLWTEWIVADFYGATLLECLRKAVEARKAWYVSQEEKRLKLLRPT